MSVKLEDYKFDAIACPRCSNCKWVDHIYIRSYRFARICPINVRYGFNAYSAQGMLDIALAVMEGRLDYTPKLLDVIYKCTLCGACDVRCKRNLEIEVLLILEALRVKSVQEEKGPMPEHKAIAENVSEKHNRYGAPHEARIGWMPPEVKPAKKADVIYFVGCSSCYQHPEIAQATVRILNAAGQEFMLLHPDEWCCGNLLISTGQLDVAKKVAQHNIDAIRDSGASTVITSCAECYKTLKVDYPKLFEKSTADMGFTVLHIAEYVKQQMESGALKFTTPLEIRVTYHDPCHLGRLSEPWVHWQGEHKKFGILEPAKVWRRGAQGIYEPPREILSSIPGMELSEMERVRENAWCCGAGGGVRVAFKDFALWAARERVEEARFTGAEAIVSCCPHCKENLAEAAQIEGGRLRVYDITEIIAQALGLGEGG
jgi:Fe-S oxidoreductase